MAVPEQQFRQILESIEEAVKETIREELEAFKEQLLEEIQKSVWKRPGGPVLTEGYKYKPPTPEELKRRTEQSRLRRQVSGILDTEDIEGSSIGEPAPKQPEVKQSRQLVNLEDLEIEEASEPGEPQPLPALRWCEACQKRIRQIVCPDCGEIGLKQFGHPPKQKRTLGDYTRESLQRDLESQSHREQEHSENGFNSDDDPNDYDTDLTW